MNAGLTVIGEVHHSWMISSNHILIVPGLMLVAPGEDYTPSEAWVLVNEQVAPYTLSGGANAGVGRCSEPSGDVQFTKRLYPFGRWADHCHVA